ncbi:hypothetical protein [Pseudomonas sp.]|uniref:hypothetical protein n=1 Tax=Pseudomonas sp. TaxID=306 RepID=UPI0028AC127C|nr:hypothetical protein [Pseudomonas sp.]
MKKSVPDLPSKIIHTPYLFIHSALSSQDALSYVEQLLQGIEESLDEYCLANAGTPWMGLLISAAHNVRAGQALLTHAQGHCAIKDSG